MTNIRTTATAVVTLLSVFAPKFLGYEIDAETQLAMVTVGVTIIGLLAKDSNVTGGTKRQ
jgi:hypothetical protein